MTKKILLLLGLIGVPALADAAEPCQQPAKPMTDAVVWMGYTGNDAVTILTETSPGGPWTIWSAKIVDGKALKLGNACKIAEGTESLLVGPSKAK